MRRRDERKRSRDQTKITPQKTQIDPLKKTNHDGRNLSLKPSLSPPRNYTMLIDTSVGAGTMSRNMAGMTHKYSNRKADRNRSIGRLFPDYGIADSNIQTTRRAMDVPREVQ